MPKQALESADAPSVAWTWPWGSWRQGYGVWGAQGLRHFPSPLHRKAQSQVSTLAYRAGNVFVPPKVQLLTLARQLFISSK